MTHQSSISIDTTGHGHMTDLTAEVTRIVAESGFASGTVHVFNVGSTASIGVIEFEPGLERDLPEILDRLMPPSRDYGHEPAWHDGNGHSHLPATVLGPALTVPLTHSRPVEWMSIVAVSTPGSGISAKPGRDDQN